MGGMQLQFSHLFQNYHLNVIIYFINNHFVLIHENCKKEYCLWNKQYPAGLAWGKGLFKIISLTQRGGEVGLAARVKKAFTIYFF